MKTTNSNRTAPAPDLRAVASILRQHAGFDDVGEEHLVDLVTDLGHFAWRVLGTDPEAILAAAQRHLQVELPGAGPRGRHVSPPQPHNPGHGTTRHRAQGGAATPRGAQQRRH